jgi:hypothetical protein
MFVIIILEIHVGKRTNGHTNVYRVMGDRFDVECGM